MCRWFLWIQLQETCQCLMKWESWNNHADVSRNAKSLCKQRFLPPSPSWHLISLMTLRESADKSAQLTEFFLFSYVLHLDRWSGCAWVEWTILWLFEVLQRHQVMFWFIFSTNAVVHISLTGLVTPTTYIKSWKSTIGVELDLWVLSWREPMIGLCKIAAAKMYWCSWFGSMPRHIVPIRKISCWNYVIETDLSDL